jgi:hypothetical protein
MLFTCQLLSEVHNDVKIVNTSNKILELIEIACFHSIQS